MQSLGGLVAEQNLRSLHGSLIFLGAVHHGGDFLGEPLLHGALARVCLLLFDEGVDFLLGERSEDFDVFHSLFIAYVEPELVELVRGCAGRVKPNVAALGLAEFLAVGFGDKRAGEGIGLSTERSEEHTSELQSRE